MSEVAAPPHHEVDRHSAPHRVKNAVPQSEAIEPLPVTETHLPPVSQNTETIAASPLTEHIVQTETPKPVYNATFTTDIANSLQRAGIKVDWVNPVALGEGANHLVYSYAVPGEPERVVKIAKEKSTTTLTHGGAAGEEKGITVAQNTFGAFAAQAEVKADPQNKNKYYVVQEIVKGKSISNKRFKESAVVRSQLAEIVKLNNKLYNDKKMCLDFVGMPGFTGWLKKQFGKLILRKSEFEVSNIIEDANGKLKIIDFEYFDLGKQVGSGKKMSNFIGMTVNRVLMKHYFGLDIKKG